MFGTISLKKYKAMIALRGVLHKLYVFNIVSGAVLNILYIYTQCIMS